MPGRINFLEGVDRFRIPANRYRTWELKEIKDLSPALKDNLARLGIAGVCADMPLARDTFLAHQVNLNASFAIGIDFRDALSQIFGGHGLGVAFIPRKTGETSQILLCFLSNERHIKDIGAKNLLARPFQPFLPIIAQPELPREVLEQTVRTREPGILPGKAIGHVKIFDRQQIMVPLKIITEEEVAREIGRIDEALAVSLSELKASYDGKVAAGKMEKVDSETFYDMESILLEDIADKARMIYRRDREEIARLSNSIPELKQFIAQEALENPHIYSAEFYFHRVFDICCNHFKKSKDPVFFTKENEIRVLAIDMLYKMMGSDHLAGLISNLETEFLAKGRKVILIAEYLGGKEVDRLKGLVDGLIVNKWTRESHGAIVSKGVLPGVVQPSRDFIEEKRGGSKALNDGDIVIIDGDRGEIILHPSEPTIKDWMGKIEDARLISQKDLVEATSADNLTKDGMPFSLLFNLDTVAEVSDEQTMLIMEASEARQKGKNGIRIGLFRTEYLFADGRIPPLEEFVGIFNTILERAWGLTARLPDVGLGTDKDFFGDGELDAVAAVEMNPDMGVRGIRLLGRDQAYTEATVRMLQAAAIVNAQLKAAKSSKSMSIMVPMVTDTLDLDRIKLEAMPQVKERLDQGGVPFDLSYPILAMSEIPATAIMADWIFRRFDGVSVGTNDLVQFTLATDRRNSAVARIMDPLHPAVLRSLKMIIDEKRKNPGKPLSVCGVHAGNPAVAFVYRLLGVEDLSINRTDYVAVKKALTRIALTDYPGLAKELLDLPTGQSVRQHLKERLSLETLALLGLMRQ